jgi:hypothetical protein
MPPAKPAAKTPKGKTPANPGTAGNTGPAASGTAGTTGGPASAQGTGKPFGGKQAPPFGKNKGKAPAKASAKAPGKPGK